MRGKNISAEDLTAKKELALEVIRRLKAEYPDAGCTLDYDHAWQLLVSVRLAAQCTDARGRARGHRSHRQTLRAGPQQGPGHLSLYADAAGQVRLQGTYDL